MNPAIIVVDMVKDNLKPEYPISAQIRSILPSIQRLLKEARDRGHRVIYACDSYREKDFIFQGRMKPHSLEGTPGAEVMDELAPAPEDLMVHKRRFSAFFATGLDRMLRTHDVDTIVISGVTTQFCVLMTALDGVCHDFRVIVLEDCCTSHRLETHRATVEIYKQSPLEPLLQFMTLEDFWVLWEANSRDMAGQRGRNVPGRHLS
jgi:nicotinamidase-related amidase